MSVDPGQEAPAEARPTAVGIAEAWARELPGVPVRSVALVTAVKVLATTLRGRRETALRELGVDAATLDLLATLRRAGDPYELTTRALSEQCLVTAGAISQRVSRAEAEGLVLRRPGPGRRVDVALTAAGHLLVEGAARHVLEGDDRAVAALDDATRSALEQSLVRWQRALSGE